MSETNNAPATPPATPPVAPVTQPVTPPAAPVAPAAPAAPVDTAAPTTPAYEPDTGSRQLDVALRYFVSELGLRPESPEIQELLRTGNVNYVSGAAALAGKADALAPFLELAKGGFDEVKGAHEKRNTELRGELEGYAGGKENLDKALAFVKSGSTPEQLEQFDKALEMGGLVGRAVVEMFVRQMNTNPDTTVVGQSATTPNPGATPPESPRQFQSRDEWRAAQRKLIDQHGLANYANTPEGKQLLAAFPR